jgi:uncharacterized protein YegJ (DUF2314 family)
LRLCMRVVLISLLISLQPAWADALTAAHSVPLNDQAVADASQKAIAHLDDFLVKLANPPSGTYRYAVKLGIIDQGSGYAITRDVGLDKVEFFWMIDITKTPAGYVGTLSNTPELVAHVATGQRIPFTRADIFDWLYIDNGKRVGNYTACPVLEAGPVADLKQYEAETGATCDNAVSTIERHGSTHRQRPIAE